MSDIIMGEIETRLLAGLPIEVESVGKLYSPTLRQIVEYGETKYRLALNAITFDKKHIPDADDQYSDFDYLLSYAAHDEDFKKVLFDGLELLFRDYISFSKVSDDVAVSIGDTLEQNINHENFFEVRKIIKITNCLEGIEAFHDNPANERARQLLEKKKLLKQKVNKAKNGDGDNEPLTMSDLISVLAGCSQNYNLINNENNPMSVWNLTIYQFNNAFNRLRMFKDYDVNIQALIHGAKSEDIELRHWISKIKTNDD